MIEGRLREAPFVVRCCLGRRSKPARVIGFSQNDPGGVGGGLFPDMATAYFESGGWILVGDLRRYYEIVA